MLRKAFTLIELLVVVAIIGIVAGFLFPVFDQVRAKGRQSVCLSNTRQVAAAALMYAQDFDETFPRLNNNGQCRRNEPGCSLPDWWNPGTDPKVPPAMFWNVLQPYIKSRAVGYCPEIGKTDWPGVVAHANELFGISWGSYDPRLEDHYYGAVGQMAVNALVIDCIPPSVPYGPPLLGHPRSRLARIARTAVVVLYVSDSVWDNDLGARLALGNTVVWPNTPGTPCVDAGQGWTWYVHHPEKGRTGSRAAVESGWANVAMCDGHAKAFSHTQLEKCEFLSAAGFWTYPYWDPRY